MSVKCLLVVPINNTTMEPELRKHLPTLASLEVARVARPPRTLLLEDLPAYGVSTLDAVRPFADQRFDLVVYGCTAAGFLGGPKENAIMEQKLQDATGATVVSTSDAMVRILKDEGVETATVVTPYLQVVNEGLRRYFEESDLRIDRLSSFECATTEHLGRITEPEVRAKALDTLTPESKALFIACSQLPTYGILDGLRNQTRIPVWSSIAATARLAQKRMSIN